MRQLINMTRDAASQGTGSVRRGVVYLSWHSADSRSVWDEKEQAGMEAESREARAGWKQFIEQAVAERWGSCLRYEGKSWLHDDLFLLVSQPEGSAEPMEKSLLELAVEIQTSWANEYLAGYSAERSRLYAGVAEVGQVQSPRGYAGMVYQAMKNAMVHGQREESVVRSMKLHALERLIAERAIASVYQPIMSIETGGTSIFGYEALSRSKEYKWFPGPYELFSFAEKEGYAYSLDILAREKALEGVVRLDESQKLFINVQSQIMNDPHFSPGQTLRTLEQRGLTPRQVVFELTERSAIDDFSAMQRALEHYRSQGYQIAIDDVGAGYSSLQSIALLKPDYIKVDRSIIDRVDEDDVKEHILDTLVQLASKLQISIIAEGIEREEELAKAKELGVHFAQGYLLGRPGPFPAMLNGE
ncbi:EAL domain-containing protein [Paenibacillus sp. NPDC058071]|uniref:EAL domain-containing protein n=1 Tax=Paenibacillus sp. NPDC058071 TaxID=3346326 RepID=UPI0036DBD624